MSHTGTVHSTWRENVKATQGSKQSTQRTVLMRYGHLM